MPVEQAVERAGGRDVPEQFAVHGRGQVVVDDGTVLVAIWLAPAQARPVRTPVHSPPVTAPDPSQPSMRLQGGISRAER